jgi:hypothetical protein
MDCLTPPYSPTQYKYHGGMISGTFVLHGTSKVVYRILVEKSERKRLPGIPRRKLKLAGKSYIEEILYKVSEWISLVTLYIVMPTFS